MQLVGLLVHFGVNLFIEEALSQHVKFSILLPDCVSTHKLKLFECELVKLIFNFPDVGLLQLGYCLFGGGLLFGGLAQVGLLSWRNIRRFNESVSLDNNRVTAGL